MLVFRLMILMRVAEVVRTSLAQDFDELFSENKDDN
jgi:hypothetical protein